MCSSGANLTTSLCFECFSTPCEVIENLILLTDIHTGESLHACYRTAVQQYCYHLCCHRYFAYQHISYFTSPRWMDAIEFTRNKIQRCTGKVVLVHIHIHMFIYTIHALAQRVALCRDICYTILHRIQCKLIQSVYSVQVFQFFHLFHCVCMRVDCMVFVILCHLVVLEIHISDDGDDNGRPL